MTAAGKWSSDGPEAVVSIPDLRDYRRINAEVVRHLAAGHPRVQLAGAQGQRLLLAGLTGAWPAVVEIEGDAGPELAASLDAPGLLIVCRGSAADGAARALRAGRLLILGSAGDAVGYTQAGGTVVVRGAAGHRAGLCQAAGTLILNGPVGRLAGERQTGGLLVTHTGQVGPHSGFGQLGGRRLTLPAAGATDNPPDPGDLRVYQQAIQELAPWVEDAR